jgi:site-specific recombinase XerD
MKKFDVSLIAELAYHKLKSEGVMKGNKLSAYKTIGFRTAIKHFESIGDLIVDKDIVRKYLESQYEIYKDDKKRKCRWQLIKRSAELLIYFAATGRVDLPRQPRWTKRDCKLYVEPLPEQLGNNDNIYGLVWRTRNALKAFGYADSTIKYYDLSGFVKILAAHEEAGTEIYSEKLSVGLVTAARGLIKTGCHHKSQAIRKTVALVDEFHRYGTIEASALSPFNMELPNPEYEALIEEYANDALLSGKSNEVSVRNAKSMLKRFLLDLESAGVFSFDKASLSTIGDVITHTASTYYKGGAEALLHYVRDFLKYLYEYDHITENLSVAAPKISAPFKRAFKGFSDDEIKRLLSAVDRSTPVGKRDYAMMTLAAQTGLRAVDIVKLKRSDIDWRKKEINITQSKTGEPLCLTLEIESGNAIYDYLINARQKCDVPNVFLRSQYPLRALNAGATQGIVKKYMKIAGIEFGNRDKYGFHSFRRAFGTRLLESGTPIHLLSQLLGHIELDSAKPYISVNEQGLKECCLSLILDECGGETI